MKNVRYIFVTGGVASSLGKGVSIAAIGTLLESRGYKVTIQKMDPYLNIDPGTMSPYQHGEVYVTDDGAETDLDLGYYERFTNSALSYLNSVSTGQVYYTVIQRERKGEYLGRTVQVIPHITNEIKNRILLLEKNNPDIDFVLVEIGGTVGDIESVPFLEAIRQFRLDKGPERTLFVHLTLLPTISPAGEVKTKPTQHSVKELLNQGIQPDILICRAKNYLDDEVKSKISLFCNVTVKRVISAPDIDYTIYEIPNIYHKEKLDDEIMKYFKIENTDPLFSGNPTLEKWESVVQVFKNPESIVKIALVGKYIVLSDAYRSLREALWHGGLPLNSKVEFINVDSEILNSKNVKELLKDAHGILVPGGFGERGISGKLDAITYARENKIPYLGICLGMQCAVIEFARNVLKMENANSREFNADTIYPVIDIMEDQVSITDKGGTMRLGAYPAKLVRGSLLQQIYNSLDIKERHRHRFEFNNRFRNDFLKSAMLISATSPDDKLVEAIELNPSVHPWFIGTQYHPEFKSQPLKPHPLFVSFIEHSRKMILKKK